MRSSLHKCNGSSGVHQNREGEGGGIVLPRGSGKVCINMRRAEQVPLLHKCNISFDTYLNWIVDGWGWG